MKTRKHHRPKPNRKTNNNIEMQIIPETQTDSSFPHTPTNDAQQPDISKSNTPTPEKQEKTNTQIQISSPTLVSNRFLLLQDTPNPDNINTPDTTSTNNEIDNEILTPTSPTP